MSFYYIIFIISITVNVFYFAPIQINKYWGVLYNNGLYIYFYNNNSITITTFNMYTF